MVYYNPRYDLIAINTTLAHINLLEYTEDGYGVFVLTDEWIVVGTL